MPETANRLVTETLDLVGLIVGEVSARFPRHVDRSELWGAGALGLVEASRRYDPDSGVPFSRFAAIRIRGAILDSTRSRDWASRSVRRRAREVNWGVQSLEQETGRSPSQPELAAFIGITIEELHRRQAEVAGSSLLHLDMPGEDGESPLHNLIEDQDTGGRPESCLDDKELRATLRDALGGLPSQQREVLVRYYLSGEMLRDIAADFGLTEARVSQIRAEALLSIRAFFSTLYEGVPEVPAGAPGRRLRAVYLETVQCASKQRTRLTVDIAAVEPAQTDSAAAGPIDPGDQELTHRR